MPTRLLRAPTFVAARAQVGAVAVDAATINDTNYPLTSAIEPYGGSPKLVAYWCAGGGTVAPYDWLDLQVMLRDAKNTASARWVEGEIRSGVRQNEQAIFDVHNCTMVYLRIVGVSCAAGTGVVLMAASAG